MKRKVVTQEDRILEYLQTHVGITQKQAIEKFGIYRLSDKIFKLRNAGYVIVTNRKKVKNRYGEDCNIAEYRLCQD